MNKYLWAECPVDVYPVIRTIMARSYNDAVEKIINTYSIELDDDDILNCDTWDLFRDCLNDRHDIALSDLEIHEEL